MALITITGPTGSGKTTLSHRLEQVNIPPLVSCTTRPIREGEIKDRHYHFLSEIEMDNEPLVQMAHYGGYRYGLQESEILKIQNRDVCIVVNPEGRSALESFCKEFSIPLLTLYITTTTEILIRRLIDRGGEGVERRIIAAVGEQENWLDGATYNKIYSCFEGEDVVDVALLFCINWCHNCRCIGEAVEEIRELAEAEASKRHWENCRSEEI